MGGLAHYRLIGAVAVLIATIAEAGPPRLQADADAARLYDLATREAQLHSLAAIPSAEVEYSRFGRLRQLNGYTGIRFPALLSAKRGDSAAIVLRKLKPMLFATGLEGLKVREVANDGYGGYYIFIDQEIDGIPVLDGGLNLRTTATGEVRALTSRFVPRAAVPSTRTLTSEQAKHRVSEMLIATNVATAPSLFLEADGARGYWTDEGKAEFPRLLWLVRAQFTTPDGERDQMIFGVDVSSGDIRYSERRMFRLNRNAYSLGYRSTLNVNSWPEQLTYLWSETNPDPDRDPHAYDAWRFASAPVFAWSETGFGYQYETINVVVHFQNYGFAGFLGSYFEPYLVFGDKYARDMDAVAHEYGHGLFLGKAPSMPNGFRWWDEWFAGNEFFADMSAIFTDYYRTGGTDWYVTDVRNLQNPISTGGLNWYPEKSHFGTTDAVAYANSTIYSYAMYLLLQGGYHHRAGQTSIIGGVTIPHILVTAQPSSAVKAVLLGAISDLRFNDQKFTAPNLKAMMVARAYNMYGSAMAQEVSNAWTAVGVGYNCSGPPAIPQFQTWPAYCRAQNTFTWAAEPGVKYHGVIKATYQSWDFGAITTTDGPVSSCEVNPNQAAVFRMRACNGCGCSEWSYEEYLPFWSPCQ